MIENDNKWNHANVRQVQSIESDTKSVRHLSTIIY